MACCGSPGMDTASRAVNTPSSVSLRRSRALVPRCRTASTRLRSSRPVCGLIASGRSAASSMITDRPRSLASCSAMCCRCSSNTLWSFPAVRRVMRSCSYICRSRSGQPVSAVVAVPGTARARLGTGPIAGWRQPMAADTRAADTRAAEAQAAETQAVLVPTLAGRYYTDPAILAAECERIFERQWYYAGRADEIAAPGQFIRRRAGRETVLLVRGKDRVIRGFLNVCRHRGAQLCLTDAGDTRNAIHCPYHNWIYGLDGALITAPNWRAMADIDKGAYGLHPVRAQV